MPPAPDDRIGLPAVARLFGVSEPAVLAWTKKGVRGHVLPSFMVGGRRFVATADLERFQQAIQAPIGKGG